MAGKRTSSQNASTHGLYGSVLKGKDLVRLETVRSHSTGDILQSNFELLHAKLMGVVGEGEGRIPSRFEKIFGIATMLVEQDEMDMDDLADLKQMLMGADLETIARISVTAAGLASAARACAEDGRIAAQNAILKTFVVDVLRQTQDTIARQLAVRAIAQLKLDAGVPTEELEALISEAKAPAEDDEAADSGDVIVDEFDDD